MRRNPKAYIRLRGRTFDVSCFLGAGPAVVTSGGAEYETQRRPGANAVTVFAGNALVTMDVPVLFDGWKDENDVWPHVEQVLNLARGEGHNPPPNFVATGPIPYSGSRFQMLLPEWGDGLRSEDGTLVRQALTLKLIEFNDPTTIRFKKAPATWIGKIHNGGTTAPPSSIKLKHAASLLEVAAEIYGDPDKAAAIGKLNGIKDLRKKLPAGKRLKLPSGDGTP